MSKQTKALRLLVPLNLVLLYLPGYSYYYYHYFASETREKKCARSPRACLTPHGRYNQKINLRIFSGRYKRMQYR